MEGKKYKISIKGEGVDIERDVCQEIGNQIIILALKEQHKIPVTKDGEIVSENNQSNNSEKEISIREFFDSKKPKRNPDKIVCIAQFLKEIRGQNNFSMEDIKNYLQKAAEPLPANLPRDFKWTISSGWITEKHDDKGLYYVTSTGSSVVNDNFPRETLKKAPSKKRTKQKNGN